MGIAQNWHRRTEVAVVVALQSRRSCNHFISVSYFIVQSAGLSGSGVDRFQRQKNLEGSASEMTMKGAAAYLLLYAWPSTLCITFSQGEPFVSSHDGFAVYCVRSVIVYSIDMGTFDVYR